MGYLEEGDILEATEAARAVGDDRIQKELQGYVVLDSFTHGTFEQRMKRFQKGYEGEISVSGIPSPLKVERRSKGNLRFFIGKGRGIFARLKF